MLRAQDVRTVVLAYDSQPRPVHDGVLTLAPEEVWTLHYGQRLVDAGLTVRVLRLPLEGGEHKRPKSLAGVRASIETLMRDHALNGEGFLVLAHPPGTGKGHNTAAGLQAFMQASPDSGRIVCTGLRKEQINDQGGITLTPLHGRNHANCGKLGEAQALSARGYNVRAALCQRRCPFVNSCAYLRQFAHTDDVFAAQDLLQATGWWEEAGVLVLDEFDPGRPNPQNDQASLAHTSWS